MSSASFGWLDATVFIHVLFSNDPHRARCQTILEAIESGSGEGWIDPVVIHELTYVLPRFLPDRFGKRIAVAEYLLSFLTLDSLHSTERDLLIATLQIWSSGSIGFADARLTALAHSTSMTVCSVNQRDFPNVPNSFPA